MHYFNYSPKFLKQDEERLLTLQLLIKVTKMAFQDKMFCLTCLSISRLIVLHEKFVPAFLRSLHKVELDSFTHTSISKSERM